MKICSKCGVSKSEERFSPDKRRRDGLQARCKECRCGDEHQWRLANQGKKRERDGRSWISQKERRKEYSRKRYHDDPVRSILKSKKWVSENRLASRGHWKKSSIKRRKDSQVRLSMNIGGQVYRSLKSDKGGRTWESILGFTLSDLKKHLEKKFKPGMSWENYGHWHVDHIIPVSAFNFKDNHDADFKRCWNIKNLQPLSGKENSSKKDKVSVPFQPSLTI